MHRGSDLGFRWRDTELRPGLPSCDPQQATSAHQTASSIQNGKYEDAPALLKRLWGLGIISGSGLLTTPVSKRIS